MKYILSSVPGVKFLLITVLLFSASHAQSAQYDAAFFTCVQNDVPTTADSVWIISRGYFQLGGKVVDSAFSTKGNDIIQRYTVRTVDPTVYYDGVTLRRSPGRLAAGSYRIITTTLFLTLNQQTLAPDTTRYCDTTVFHVVSPGTALPRVVDFKTSDSWDPDRGDAACSYYYRTGDTLNLALTYSLNYMPSGFICHADRLGDTTIVDIIDTILTQDDMSMSYLWVVSLYPIPQGTFPVRVKYKRWSCVNPFVNNTILSTTIDCNRESAGIGFKKNGIPLVVLFPDTSVKNFPYQIFLPPIDSVNFLCLKPDPYGTIPKRHDLFIGQLQIGNQSIVNLDSTYQPGKWQVVVGQSGDHIALNTAPTIDKGSFLHLNYSAAAGGAFKSYASYPVTPAIGKIEANSLLRLYASYIRPDSSSAGIRAAGPLNKSGFGDFSVIKRGRVIELMFYMSKGLDLMNGAALTVFDLRGHQVQKLNPITSGDKSGNIVVRWDGRNHAGERMGSGTYIVRLFYGQRVYAGKITIS